MNQCSIREIDHLLFTLLALAACSAPVSPGGPAPAAPQGGAGGAGLVASAPGKEQPGATANCVPWAQVLEGAHRYVNDQWGSNKAKGPFEQCLLTRAVNDKREIGWTWSWPGFDASVFAYPSATFGWKPWSGGESTDARLPVQVADIQDLTLHYAVETDAHGSFNLAPELWFTKALNSAPEADPKLITKEIMFWMEYAGDAVPAGSPVDALTMGGERYELWKEDTIGKDANGIGWMLITVKSAETRQQASIPIHEVLRELVQRGLVSDTEYLASIEFGNEVMGGTGTTWVRQLEVELTLNEAP